MTDRGVSVTVNYVLTLAITAILLSGLFVASGSLIQSQSERAIQDELDVLGERLAADLSTADRLAESADGEAAHVRVSTELPRRVAGTAYSIEITWTENGGNGYAELTFRTSDPEIESSTRVVTATEVTAVSELRGGDLVITYADDGPLEVTTA
ncbi:hypothetical protein [Halalkalicoccus sp. NIPERK01]|uniref:DUF7266 family protein n=1 Tax=Halalkalicoccus sp. NIPERK01 TaxID=3053469 RepID=UPI00256F193B|nr:hypothetical protein [Halalkalicoccus sp. NIPERK01]